MRRGQGGNNVNIKKYCIYTYIYIYKLHSCVKLSELKQMQKMTSKRNNKAKCQGRGAHLYSQCRETKDRVTSKQSQTLKPVAR